MPEGRRILSSTTLDIASMFPLGDVSTMAHFDSLEDSLTGSLNLGGAKARNQDWPTLLGVHGCDDVPLLVRIKYINRTCQLGTGRD